MSGLTRVDLDKHKLMEVVEAIFAALDKVKAEKLYAAAAFNIMLDQLRDEGVEVEAVKTMKFHEDN